MKAISRLLKIVILLDLAILLHATLTVATTEPAAGYEFSMYDPYPELLWMELILVFAVSVIVIVTMFMMRVASKTMVISAAVPLIGCMVIVYGLPFFRGCELYGAGDTLTHLGYVLDIQNTGRIGSHNFYPIIHLILLCISFSTGLDSMGATFLLTPLSAMLFALNVFVLMRSLSGSSTLAVGAAVISMIPIIGPEFTRESIMPSVLAFTLIPLAIHLFLSSYNGKFSFKISLALVLIVLPLLHPEAGLFMCFFLATVFLWNKAQKGIGANNQTARAGQRRGAACIVWFIVFVGTWFTFATEISKAAGFAYLTFSWSVVQGGIATRTVFAPSGFYESAEFVVRTYGSAAICIVTATLVLLLVQRREKMHKNKEGNDSRRLLLYLLLVSSILSLFFLTYGFTIGYNTYRMLKYPLLFALLAQSLLVKYCFGCERRAVNEFEDTSTTPASKGGFNITRSSRYLLRTVLFPVIISSLCVLSVMNTYPSPSNRGFSYELMHADFAGMEFLLEMRDTTIPINETLQRSYQTRFADALFGVEVVKPGIRNGYEQDVLLPDHFGQDRGLNLGAFFESDCYMITYPLAVNYYAEMFPGQAGLWKYSPSEVLALSSDTTVDLVYSNGGFNLYVISSDDL